MSRRSRPHYRPGLEWILGVAFPYTLTRPVRLAQGLPFVRCCGSSRASSPHGLTAPGPASHDGDDCVQLPLARGCYHLAPRRTFTSNPVPMPGTRRVGTKDCSFAPLTGRVGDWRAGLGRSSCSLLARSFVCECHTISTMPRFQPPPRRTQHADFPHCALLLASPQGLWDLSCRSRFRRGSYNPIAPEEAQFVVHPLPTPPLPVEALTIPSALHMAPDLLFHPVFHEAEALAGMSDREVIHPST